MQAIGAKKGQEHAALPKLAVSESHIPGGDSLKDGAIRRWHELEI
jgi:hypothetical protein